MRKTASLVSRFDILFLVRKAHTRSCPVPLAGNSGYLGRFSRDVGFREPRLMDQSAGCGVSTNVFSATDSTFDARIENRKIFSTRPQLIQVPVMRIVDVAGLARAIQPDRIIPILRVDDDLEGSTRNLVVAAPTGRRDREAVPAARKISDVELLLQIGSYRVRSSG